MMRFFTLIMTTILLFIYVPVVNGQAGLDISANNAILMEQASGRVLYEKSAHERQSIASLTKVMTAIIAIESGKMEDYATTSRRAIYTEGSSIYLEQGEKMLMEDLVYGLMLRSGNDAAVAISEHLAGSVEGFVYLMNEKARWLGMTNTNFANPHGLDADDHYSTAYDMALLMRYAMENEKFREITQTLSYQSKNRSYKWHNKNKLLTTYYDPCTGGKTGYTKKTGRTLLTTARKNEMDLIVVTLDAPDDWNDHIRLYEYGFEKYQMYSMNKKGKQQYKETGTEKRITGYIEQEVKFPLTKLEKLELEKKSFLVNRENQTAGLLGKTLFYINSEPIVEVPIFTVEQDKKKESMLGSILSIYKKIVRLG